MMLARCSGVSGVPLGMRPAFRMVCSVAVDGAGRRACPAAAGAPPLTPAQSTPDVVACQCDFPVAACGATLRLAYTVQSPEREEPMHMS